MDPITSSSINARLKTLRTTLGLTQTEFGEKLGVGKTAISKIESESRSLTEPMLILICSSFGASRDWLLHGSGPMFVVDLDDPVQKFASDQNLNPLQQAFISKLLALSYDELQAVYNFMEGLVDTVRASPPAESEPEDSWTDDALRAALEEQLALEKKPKDASEAS